MVNRRQHEQNPKPRTTSRCRCNAMVELKVEGKQDTVGIGVSLSTKIAQLYLDCHGLVVLEPAEAVLGFQRVAVGVLCRV